MQYYPLFKNKIISFCILSCIILFSACTPTKTIMEAPMVDMQLLDTLVVTAPAIKDEIKETPVLQTAANMQIDLKHMDLYLSFDWDMEQVLGEVILKLSPYFYTTDEITLDAKQMDILDISLTSGENLKYTYDGKKLNIKLDRKYDRDEIAKIYIKYVAKPSLGRITGDYNSGDQGLYFIDSDQSNPEIPSQIWSQGEMSHNSNWFPTVDNPNQRLTHDIKITVDTSYATLSNGYMVSSNQISSDKRVDHWRMDYPHAPYLVMITVGEFAIVEDLWEGKPLMYYVEKDYEPYAKQIFNHTPEMLSYFSEMTGIKYPWNKYAQVVIRDFVSGAMENTTAVTFGEFVQKTDRQLIDNHNDDIVAHEMFHHWFGDYVTCESWANLTLNEGFANYSEYLWTAHKYGQVEADNKRISELSGYMYQAKNQGTHPLIHYQYANEEDMFDAHSYNKGGLVLHMLRYQIGDDAFFAGMNHYLTKHAGSAVEVDELRMAYEDVTGLDLKRFFDQWYLAQGHPDLNINYEQLDGALEVSVQQVQDPETNLAVFELPLEFDMHFENGEVIREKVTLNADRDTFLFPMAQEIKWINFDPSHTLLAEWTENKTAESYIAELQMASSQYDKREALVKLRGEQVDPSIYEAILVSDENYINKWISLNRLKYDSSKKDLYLTALENADNIYLKGKLISEFAEHTDDISIETLTDILDNDRSWNVLSPALYVLYAKDRASAQKYLDVFSDSPDTDMILTIASIYLEDKNSQRFDDLLTKYVDLDPRVVGSYTQILTGLIDISDSERKPLMEEKLFNLVADKTVLSANKRKAIGNMVAEWKNSKG